MPKKCTACVFYSRARKRCIKLGVSVQDPNNPPCLSPSLRTERTEKVNTIKAEEVIIPKEERIEREIKPTPKELTKEVSAAPATERREKVERKEITKPPVPVKPPTIAKVDERRDEINEVVNELLNAKRELEEYMVYYIKSRDALLGNQTTKIGLTQLSERDIALALKELEERKNYLYKRFIELDQKAVKLGAIRCPVCNFPMPPNTKRCPYCGHKRKLKS